MHHYSIRRTLIAAPFLCVLSGAAPAFAQMEGRVIVGIGVSSTVPAASELDNDLSIGYSLGTLPRQGWGLAWAFNWYGADVQDEPLGTPGRFGRLAVRPIMLGIGYTHQAGRVSLAPSIVAGPALNTLRLDASQRPALGLEDAGFGTFSIAVRPAVTVNYGLTRRFGLSTTVGYVFNRSTFTLTTPSGPVEREWNSNVFNVRAGVIVSLF